MDRQANASGTKPIGGMTASRRVGRVTGACRKGTSSTCQKTTAPPKLNLSRLSRAPPPPEDHACGKSLVCARAPWLTACQVPISTGSCRQPCWSSPGEFGDLLDLLALLLGHHNVGGRPHLAGGSRHNGSDGSPAVRRRAALPARRHATLRTLSAQLGLTHLLAPSEQGTPCRLALAHNHVRMWQQTVPQTGAFVYIDRGLLCLASRLLPAPPSRLLTSKSFFTILPLAPLHL